MKYKINKDTAFRHDRKSEHFKVLINGHHMSPLADHVKSSGHILKWDHVKILARGQSESHCRIKETLLIKDLKPSLNEYVSSDLKSCFFHNFVFHFLFVSFIRNSRELPFYRG